MSPLGVGVALFLGWGTLNLVIGVIAPIVVGASTLPANIPGRCQC